MPELARDRTVNKKKAKCHSTMTEHPDHSVVLPRMNRIAGQIAGISKMIEDGRYCVDILVQFRAAMSALRNVEMTVFETHLRSCVREAMESRNIAESEKKLEELTDLLVKRTII